MTTGHIHRLTRFVFATPLSRELALALLIKMAALALIGLVLFREPTPRPTSDAVGSHMLKSRLANLNSQSTSSLGEPHGIGNRR